MEEDNRNLSPFDSYVEFPIVTLDLYLGCDIFSCICSQLHSLREFRGAAELLSSLFLACKRYLVDI